MNGTNPNTGPTPGTGSDPAPLLLKTGEAAALLGLTRRSLYRLIAAGQIRALKLHRRATRIEAAEIQAYLERLRAANETEVA